MKIHLIRHGRTDWNDLNHIQGKSDIPLNSTGITQAKELGCAGALDAAVREGRVCHGTYTHHNLLVLHEGFKVSHICSSFLKRAKQTADIISDILEIPCDILDGLEEVNLGDWEGISWDEVKVRYPERYDAFRHNRRYTKASGGESYEEMLQRVLPALKKLAETCKEDVIVVTHSAVIMALLCYLNGTPFEKMITYKVKNVSVITVEGTLFI